MCFQKKLALEGRIEQIRRIKCSCIEFLAFGSLGVRLDAGLSNFLAFALIRCEVGRAFFRQGSLWTLSSFSKCLLIIFVSFQQISGNINENKDHNPSGHRDATYNTGQPQPARTGAGSPGIAAPSWTVQQAAQAKGAEGLLHLVQITHV